MKILTSLTLILTLNLGAFAQESSAPGIEIKPPLPTGPILKSLPAYAQWSVVYAAPNAKLSAAPGTQPKKVRIIVSTKSGENRREVETDSAGQTWTRWKIGSYEISYTPDGHFAVSTPGTRPDFPDFNWLSPQNYTSAAKIGGLDCYIFQDTIKRPDFLNPVKVTAAVDVKTQLPVYLVIGTDPRTFRFGAPPAALAVPPEVASIVADRQKALAAYAHPR